MERAEVRPAPRAERVERSERPERRAPEPRESEPLLSRGDLMSPFEEDELDVPTFLRRSAD